MTEAHPTATGEDWTDAEVRETVQDYVAMLLAESDGSAYSKADHRRELLSRLRVGRTAAAVEFKHQNISAAMVDLGLPYIRGYKPRGNYQRALVDEIRAQLTSRPAILGVLGAERAPRRTVGAVVVEAPKSKERRAGVSSGARVIDYLALQAENTRLGRLGEELVIELEEKRLTALGREDLAKAVRWVASIDGDGAGYDILSFESNGTERHIEVKTTSLDAEAPFYMSSAEMAFAREHHSTYRLYRVYDVGREPKVFIISKCLEDALELVPVTFRARLAAR